MAIHDYVIDNQSAPAFRSDLNGALQAVVTQNSNATAPTTTYANMIWYDTAANQLKKRNEANSTWIVLGTIDETLSTFTPSGTPAIATQAEAQAGTDNTKMMTPLRSSQAISALGGAAALLGTLTTTSGSTQTLSGLNLTTYKFLRLVFNGVSRNIGTAPTLSVGTGAVVTSLGITAVNDSVRGFVDIDLFDGTNAASLGGLDGGTLISGNATGITTASTSVSVSLSATRTFDAGSIRIYGVK